MGLAISKHLASILGGTISVQSELGSGSTFLVEIPKSVPSDLIQASFYKKSQYNHSITNQTRKKKLPLVLQENIEDDRDKKTHQQPILIIEDDVGFATILRDYIQEQGHRCIVSTSAEEGKQLVFEKQPCAIILDIHLPDYSGLILLDELKTNAFSRSIPIHVVTVEDDQNRVLRLGATQFLRKPLSLENIRSLIDEINFENESFSEKSKTVLIIDSDDNQRETLSKALASKNINIVSANNGQEALNRIYSSTKKFDCIILDLRLPDISGFEILRKLEKEKNLSSFSPVIIHTSIDLNSSEEQELKSFAHSLIVKDHNSINRLLDEISMFLHRVVQNPTSLKTIRRRNNNDLLKNQNILIVDDDIRNVFSITSALEQAGASKVTMAQNGQEAIKALEENEDYDIILMDIMMPVMNGYEAIKKIRNNPRFRDLPIIALTAKSMKIDREICINSGANDYLSKPIDIQKLYSLIRIWTQKII